MKLEYKNKLTEIADDDAIKSKIKGVGNQKYKKYKKPLMEKLLVL